MLETSVRMRSTIVDYNIYTMNLKNSLFGLLNFPAFVLFWVLNRVLNSLLEIIQKWRGIEEDKVSTFYN